MPLKVQREVIENDEIDEDIWYVTPNSACLQLDLISVSFMLYGVSRVLLFNSQGDHQK